MNTKSGFENLGMGMSVIGGWVDFAGKRIWVSMMANSEGQGQRRTWNVSAEHKPDGAPVVRVMIVQPNSFRYEAADAALAALLEELAGVSHARLVA